jgi:hypothetical protein
MSVDPQYERWRELSWRRPLTAAEQAELQEVLEQSPESHDLKAEWEVDAALNRVLQRLPNASVPSNFNARVLAAVEQEETAANRNAPRAGRFLTWQFWQRWLPRSAVAGLLVGLGIAFYAQDTRQDRHVQMVESVATVAEVSSLPSPEILKDFEAIRALNRTPPADEQLLTLLQ